jgi:hypothetical protein
MEGNIKITFLDEFPEYVFFCKIGMGTYQEPEQWCIVKNASFASGTMIAHDTVEHTPEQRTTYATTVEEEYMAVGATQLCRWEKGYDLILEVENLLSYRRPSLKAMGISKEDVNTQFYDTHDLFNDTSVLSDYHYAITHLVNEGRKYVHEEFDGDRTRASMAFKFVEKHGQELVDTYGDLPGQFSVDVYFDTDKLIWRETNDIEEYFDED